MYVLQYIVLAIILAAALSYAGWRLFLTIRHSGDRCYGCKGCGLREQIRQKQRQGRTRPSCYDKK